MKNADILFVANNKNPALYRNDPSFIYRCENLALALNAKQVNTRFLHLSEVSSHAAPKVAVFHRPLASWKLYRTMTQLRRCGVTLIADVDDLVFDPEFATSSPGVANNLVSLRQTRKRFRRHKQALSWFDAITVSTAPLQDHIHRILPQQPVLCLPNCVHSNWLTESSAHGEPESRGAITYFPGTRSHDRDFRLIRNPLEAFLNDHPQARLEITGPLTFELNVAAEQIQHTERVPYDQYVHAFRSSRINLAPLEDTIFNRSKSALKAIEAGYFGIPTICSPMPDYQRLADAGAIIARSEQDWYDTLVQLNDADYYANLVSKLREKTLTIAEAGTQSQRLLDFIEQLQSPGEPIEKSAA